MSENTNFAIEFTNHADLNDVAKGRMQDEVEQRLRQLARGNTDIAGAAVHISISGKSQTQVTTYEATVTVYTRPEYTAANKQHREAQVALKEALDAVERQVRDQRDRLRNH